MLVDPNREDMRKRKYSEVEGECLQNISDGDSGDDQGTGKCVSKKVRFADITPYVTKPIDFKCTVDKANVDKIENIDVQFCHNPSILHIHKKELIDRGTSYALCYYWLNEHNFYVSVLTLCNFITQQPDILDISFNPTQSMTVMAPKSNQSKTDTTYNRETAPGLMILIKKAVK